MKVQLAKVTKGLILLLATWPLLLVEQKPMLSTLPAHHRWITLTGIHQTAAQ
jgi:hypothetical protein